MQLARWLIFTGLVTYETTAGIALYVAQQIVGINISYNTENTFCAMTNWLYS